VPHCDLIFPVRSIHKDGRAVCRQFLRTFNLGTFNRGTASAVRTGTQLASLRSGARGCRGSVEQISSQGDPARRAACATCSSGGASSDRTKQVSTQPRKPSFLFFSR
jgi:hypothetical protein